MENLWLLVPTQKNQNEHKNKWLNAETQKWKKKNKPNPNHLNGKK